MITPELLRVEAAGLLPPNDEIVSRAATYLALDTRDGLETAHNLVRDAINNIVVASGIVTPSLLAAEEDLFEARISAYGAIGRPAGDMTPPYWRLG